MLTITEYTKDINFNESYHELQKQNISVSWLIP